MPTGVVCDLRDALFVNAVLVLPNGSTMYAKDISADNVTNAIYVRLLADRELTTEGNYSILFNVKLVDGVMYSTVAVNFANVTTNADAEYKEIVLSSNLEVTDNPHNVQRTGASPKVSTRQTWLVYNDEAKAYEDTGIPAEVNLGDYYTKEETDEKVAELESAVIGVDFFSKKMMAIRTDGSAKASVEGVCATDFLPISRNIPIYLIGGFSSLVSSNIVPMAFYDADKNFISYVTGSSDGFKVEVSDIPSAAAYIRCTTYLEYDKIALFGCSLGNIWDKVGSAFVTKGVLADGTNLNDVKENGVYLLTSDYKYANAPFGIAFLWVTQVENFTLQVCFNFSGNLVKKRRASNNNWESWVDVSVDTSVFLRAEKGNFDSVDLNNVGGDVTYLMDDSHTYDNAPYDNAIGFLRVTTTNGFTLQEFYPFSGASLFKRRGKIGGIWTSWGEVSGSGVVNNITNEYNYPSFNNTYNVTATPTIKADTNNYLASTNDNTDRTTDIVAMLQATGICRLGAGQFYVSNLEMLDNTTIQGCGSATRVVLSEDATFAIKMAKQCGVQDLQLIGSVTNITPETIGERHGILWQGNYNETTSNAKQPQKSFISNLWISNFTGGGVTCYNTGYGTMCHIEAVNLNIWNCGAGINISYWSEFHKFTNVRCQQCMYGCVNNGGNNVFVNCDFSSNGEGFLMDNSQDQSPNNSHGSAIGCVFNHTASNKGIGIRILNNTAGFVFDGCQIFYSQIYIEDTDGVMFTSCNFGNSNCDITIKGGNAILFANNLFGGTPSISITGNTTTKFVNCLVRNTGAEIVA